MSDLIDRQTAIDAILHITNCKSVRELFEYNQLHHLTEMWSGGVNDAIDAVIGVDSAQLGTNLAEVGMDTISRRSAIDAVTDELDMIDHVPQWVFNRLEKRLKQLPSAQPEPCEDAVSRKAVIDMMDEWKEACADSGHKETASDIMLIRKDFIELPPVTPKQRTGHWIPVGVAEAVGGESAQWGSTIAYHKCSECDGQALRDDFEQEVLSDFCPHCGCRMERMSE